VVSDPGDEVVRLADAQAQWPQLASALQELTAVEQEVVGLHLVVGLTQSETAQALGIPIGTVKSRLSRARHKLREHLAHPGRINQRESGGTNQHNQPSEGDQDG
jgi:RNA polymerase sigma-70 factor (ECF subfamily)